jgi:hypothetical protein
VTADSNGPNAPNARGHHLVECSNPDTNEMILFGGEAKTLRYNDLYTFQVVPK